MCIATPNMLIPKMTKQAIDFNENSIDCAYFQKVTAMFMSTPSDKCKLMQRLYMFIPSMCL